MIAARIDTIMLSTVVLDVVTTAIVIERECIDKMELLLGEAPVSERSTSWPKAPKYISIEQCTCTHGIMGLVYLMVCVLIQ